MDPNRPPRILPFGATQPTFPQIIPMQTPNPIFGQYPLPMQLPPLPTLPAPSRVMSTGSMLLQNAMAAVTAAASQQQHQLNTQPMLVPPSVSAVLSEAANLSELTAPSFVNSTSKPIWSEHKSPDGAVYFYNRQTRESSWKKPDDLKTDQERQLTKCSWKEYATPDSRAYFYNSTTRETTWTIPAELKGLKDKLELVKTENIGEEESALERAMQATLKTLEGKDETVEGKESAPMINSQAVSEINEDEYQKEVKKRQSDRFRELLRDKVKISREIEFIPFFQYNDGKISSNCSWEYAVKYIQHDPRFRILNKVSEKKQIFNAWKTQRQKEEREEKRQSIKKSKEDLEKWLQANEKMTPRIRYKKAEDLFGSESVWKVVHESDRKELFHDVQLFLEKQEKELTKTARRRNIKSLADILDGMDQINFRTTWAQAQRLLIENPSFSNDQNLQNMDKEDALIVFEEHIRSLETEELNEKELEVKRLGRQRRKNRENMLSFLHELHSRHQLTSISLWCELYPVFSADQRFHNMLGQAGSTPLDLFKFYVEDLKAQYGEDRRIIKNIIKDSSLAVEKDTLFEQFQQWITADERAKSVDTGNMKLCYSSLIEKAEAREKELQKEDMRKRRRLESSFRSLLKQMAPPIDPESKWEEIRSKMSAEAAFLAIDDENDCKGLFFNYVKSLAEACGHHHSATKKKKKDKHKRKKPLESSSESDSEDGSVQLNKKRRKRKNHDEPVLSTKIDMKKPKKKKSKKQHSSEMDQPEVSSRKRSKGNGHINRPSLSRGSEEGVDLNESDLERKRKQLLKELEGDS